MQVFVGLDGEMTNSLEKMGELCQIGVAANSDNHMELFVSDIRCHQPWAFNDEAMAVHGIDRGWLTEGAPMRDVVDGRLAYFIRQVLGNVKYAIPVGWGVSYFDMPFVRRYLPHTMSVLSNRSVELGAVTYSIGATFGMSPDTLRRKSKQYAKNRMGFDKTHNAGYDAQTALLAWEYLMKVMKSGAYVPTE